MDKELNNQFDVLLNHITRLVNCAYHDAELAFKCAFKKENYREEAYTIYAVKSHASISAAKSLCYSKDDVLSSRNYNFDSLFVLFDQFIDELLYTYSTGSIQQQAYQYFEDLKEAHSKSIFKNN